MPILVLLVFSPTLPFPILGIVASKSALLASVFSTPVNNTLHVLPPVLTLAVPLICNVVLNAAKPTPIATTEITKAAITKVFISLSLFMFTISPFPINFVHSIMLLKDYLHQRN